MSLDIEVGFWTPKLLRRFLGSNHRPSPCVWMSRGIQVWKHDQVKFQNCKLPRFELFWVKVPKIFTTAEGWNPANQLIGSLSHDVTRFYTSQVVVWDFFHQQYYKYPVFAENKVKTQKNSHSLSDPFWSNFSDLTWPGPPKCSWRKVTSPYFSKKSRWPVKYYNLARSFGNFIGFIKFSARNSSNQTYGAGCPLVRLSENIRDCSGYIGDLYYPVLRGS